MATQYWLMKSEPKVYSIADLKRDGQSAWEGVRNYQARNFMRDVMRVGDGVLFYHSSATPPGIAGFARVAREAYPDPSQFDPKSEYYDAGATKDTPRWFLVDIAYVAALEELLPLERLRGVKALKDMALLQRGQRLSIQPVTAGQWRCILKLCGVEPE